MTQPTCETCRFWKQHCSSDGLGNCCRNPPVLIGEMWAESKDLEHATRFPVAFHQDWCGEHQERKPEGEE